MSKLSFMQFLIISYLNNQFLLIYKKKNQNIKKLTNLEFTSHLNDVSNALDVD